MKRLISNIIVAISSTLFLSTSQAALSVFADLDGDFVHDTTHAVAAGSVFSVSVYAQEDGLHGGLSTYGLQTHLSPTLAVAGATPVDQLANIISGGQWDLPESKAVAPAIEVIDGSIFSSFSGLVHLFDIKLQAPNVSGTYIISFSNVEPDITFDSFVGLDGFVYDATASFAATEVRVVPLPLSLPLLASALAGLGWAAKRRR
jgi:hypothetical protein